MKLLSYETFQKNWKRYLYSSLVTFAAGVLMSLLANWNEITLEAFKDGSILGTFFVVIRAGAKAFVEYLLAAIKPDAS